jgi:hypothetical protein
VYCEKLPKKSKKKELDELRDNVKLANIPTSDDKEE